jgi:phosphatidylinositol alpha-1,6-mannosyltransferase
MKILFISRAYPPVVGGIEKLNFEISHALTEFADIKVIANTQGKSALPFFLF